MKYQLHSALYISALISLSIIKQNQQIRIVIINREIPYDIGLSYVILPIKRILKH